MNNESIKTIADTIKNNDKPIIIVYAFNSTGKTRLSVSYKDRAKDDNGNQTGVYYNAFSEDIFVWDNDNENNEQNITLTVNHTSLNLFHSSIDETKVREKLDFYSPKYDFKFNTYEYNPEKGIKSIEFFLDHDSEQNIKISRGEERIFVWCFFLALFEVDGWVDKQSKYFFIDDPVSSLDDHNLYKTASTILELIENNYEKKKIIITTHHIGLFSTLRDWLTRGEKADEFKNRIAPYILDNVDNQLELKEAKDGNWLYHLQLLSVIDDAIKNKAIYPFHFMLLRQVLETIGSFLGVPSISGVLQKLDYDLADVKRLARLINNQSHFRVYDLKTAKMNDDLKKDFINIFEKLKDKFEFNYQ